MQLPERSTASQVRLQPLVGMMMTSPGTSSEHGTVSRSRVIKRFLVVFNIKYSRASIHLEDDGRRGGHAYLEWEKRARGRRNGPSFFIGVVQSIRFWNYEKKKNYPIPVFGLKKPPLPKI